MMRALDSAKGSLPAPVTTRFAPSPTGYLHLGHVASALYVWGLGHAFGARVLLRLEDHDRSRCRLEYEEAICADLAWLGLAYDNAELRSGVRSDYRQSDCEERYAEAIEILERQGLLYACSCSRQDIALRRGEVPLHTTELRYDGYCRDRGLPLATPDTGLRLRLADRLETFNDLYCGPQSQRPSAQCGDLLLRDRLGYITYNFAVVVDDLRHGVNLIIRGQDVMHATGRQLQLAALLTPSPPELRFFHHPLVGDSNGRKLSKRFLAEAVANRRVRGEPPETTLGEAAFAVGLLAEQRPLHAQEVAALFQQGRWPPAPETPHGGV